MIIDGWAHIDRGSANLDIVVVHCEGNIVGLERNIGRVVELGGQWSNDVLISTVTTTASNRDIAEIRSAAEAVDP